MMMIFQIVPSLFILITFYLQNQVLSSPVLLWGSNVNLPELTVPLSKLSSLNLISDYICKSTNEQIQLRLFAVNDLTIEDIQRGLERDHPLLLDAKKDKTNFHFYPHVDDNIKRTLTLLPQSNNMKCSHIHFQLISSKTYKTLSDALNKMQTAIDNTDTTNGVIMALINDPTDGHKLSRQRRQTNATPDNTVLMSTDETCMFFANKLYWNNVNGTKLTGQSYNLNFAASSCTPNIPNPNNYSSVILNLVWNNDVAPFDTVSISLTTTIIGLYWYLENAFLNNKQYRYFAFGMQNQMDTPPTFSYVCNTAIFVRYDNSTPHGQYNFSDKFFLSELQFQPFNGNGLAFGSPNYCTSFFTSGIWMGITSSLLCLGILLFGIHRLMSIKSNNRFDDPKGKPLLIKTHD